MSFIDTPVGLFTKSEGNNQSAGSLRHAMRNVRLPSTGVVIVALVGIALALRLWELDARPLHHDESLDAWWSWKFLNGTYDGYDPVYHGPLRFYITAGFFQLFGESEAIARLFSALSGTAVVGLPWFLRRELGRPGTIFAAVALAISPTMLYYSRFGREDAQMVFLGLLAMVLGLSYLRQPRTITAVALSFTLASSFAIKESAYLFVMLLVAFLLIVAAAQFDALNRVAREIETDPDKLNPAFVASTLALATIGLLVAVIVGAGADELFPLIALFFAGLIAFVAITGLAWWRNRDRDNYQWPALFRSFGAIGYVGWAATFGVFAIAWLLFFTVWGARPGDWHTGFTSAISYWDSQQEVNRGGQPWFYYLYALPIYEWLFVALAAVGTWRGLRRPTMLSILMIWFALGSLILYSYAGERMPWLIAHPLLPILILAAIGVQHLWQHRDRAGMGAVAGLIGLALIFTLGTSVRASFPNGADSREILSQAGQATPHLTTALARLENIDAISVRETGEPAQLAIGTANAWPYSWYLRDRAVTWFDNCTGPPTDGSADVIIVDRSMSCTNADGSSAVRNVVDEVEFFDYQSNLFAMRSWWVPTYNDAGPLGWVQYARDRSLWEQNPNPNFVAISEISEDEVDSGLGATLDRLKDGVNASASGLVNFAGADRSQVITDPSDSNAEINDGRDGCGSVDQWFMVHNRFAFSEAVVNADTIAEMGPLDCVSDLIPAP